jgi:hypothetical protein
MSVSGPIRVVLTAHPTLPVYPNERTSSEAVGMAQICQKRIHAAQQKRSLIDHLVSAGEQR